MIGTDIVHAVPLTLVSGLGHLSMGNTNLTLLGLLLVGSLPGIALGSRLTGKLAGPLSAHRAGDHPVLCGLAAQPQEFEDAMPHQ